MKKSVNGLFLSAILGLGLTQNAWAFDIPAYKKIADETIQAALSGTVDVDALTAKQHTLIKMGKAACLEHAKNHPADAKLMTLVANNADAMTKMTLEVIEEEWHDGGFLDKNGIDFDGLPHFGAAISLMDTVVHPATVIIALRNYKTSEDGELLVQVKDELSEVLKHITHIK